MLCQLITVRKNNFKTQMIIFGSYPLTFNWYVFMSPREKVKSFGYLEIYFETCSS